MIENTRKIAINFFAIVLSCSVFAADAERTLPNALVTKLSPMTLAPGSYTENGIAKEGTVDRPLQVVMNFKAMETAEEARPNGFLPYKCDFYLTFSGLKGDSFTAKDCYLAGNYGDFGWIVLSADDLTLEKDVTYPVLGGYAGSDVDLNITYKQICDEVKNFTAAIYIAPEILSENPDMKVKLELKMTNPTNSSEVLVIGEPAVYGMADLKRDFSMKVIDPGAVKVNGALPSTEDEEAIKMIVSEFTANANIASVKSGLDAAANAPAVAAAKKELVEAGVSESAAALAIPVVTVTLSEVMVGGEEDASVLMNFDVSPVVSLGEKSVKITSFESPVTFRLPVFSGETKKYAKIYHEGVLSGIYPVKGEDAAKYVEVSSKEFSSFTLEPYEYPVVIGETGYETLEAAFAAVPSNGVVTVMDDIEISGTLTVPAGKDFFTLDLNGFSVFAADEDASAKIVNFGEIAVKDSSEYLEGNFAVPFENGGKAYVRGGMFLGGVVNSGTVEATGGVFLTDVDRTWICDGYACGKVAVEEDLSFYVVAKLPSATVTAIPDAELDAAAPPFTYSLKFKANDVSLVQMLCFTNWYADFELTVSDDVTFDAVDGTTDGYLAGSYDNWKSGLWISVPTTNVTLKAGETLRIMDYGAELLGKKGLKMTYGEVATFVKAFKCGVVLRDAFLKDNPGFKVGLSLKMYNPENEAECYTIGSAYEFTVPSDTHFATVEDVFGNIVNCESMADVVESVVASGEAANGGEVVLLKDTTITEDLTMTGTGNLFVDIDSGKTLTLAEGKKFSLSNVNVAFTGAGSLSGFTAENVTLDDNSVLTLPFTESTLAKSFEADHYVTENEDGTWSVAKKFQLQIQMADGAPSLGFLKDTRRTYTIEASSDLVNWKTVSAEETPDASVTDPAVPLKWNTPLSGKFFRVKATDR